MYIQVPRRECILLRDRLKLPLAQNLLKKKKKDSILRYASKWLKYQIHIKYHVVVCNLLLYANFSYLNLRHDFFTLYIWHLTRTQQSPLASSCPFREWGCTPVKTRNRRRNRHLIHSLSRCGGTMERWTGEKHASLLGPVSLHDHYNSSKRGASSRMCPELLRDHYRAKRRSLYG